VIQLDSSGNMLSADEELPDRRAVMRQAWRLAHEDAVAAYRRWAGAPAKLRADAYCVYVATADREAAAAVMLHTVTAAAGAR
jgi:hypothetical protein